MDMIAATKIIQDQATANGTSFDDEFWAIANNLRSCSDNVYDAWSVIHNSVNEYFRRQADRDRIHDLAWQVKVLNPAQQAYFDSI